MHIVSAEDIEASIGEITISTQKYGLVLTPGIHGFRLHENGSRGLIIEKTKKSFQVAPRGAL